VDGKEKVAKSGLARKELREEIIMYSDYSESTKKDARIQ